MNAQLPVLLFLQAGGEEVLGLPRLVDGHDGGVAGAGQLAGALHDFAQDGLEVEARADAQARRAQSGHALPQQRVLSPKVVGTGQVSPLIELWRKTIRSRLPLEPEPDDPELQGCPWHNVFRCSHDNNTQLSHNVMHKSRRFW